MNFIVPEAEELTYLRPDPLLWEQELDVRPQVAEALEKAVGMRAGRAYWRSEHDHLYSLELADLGRGRPSMARVSGHWDRWEPRPPEHEIDADLLAFSMWVAEIGDFGPQYVQKVAQHAGIRPAWPEGSVLRTPEDRFAKLPGYPYEAKYLDVEGLRMAYVEEGSGDPILMLHGEPTWGYLYRKMIPTLAGVGRVIVPDLIGFGRSDKPRAANAYSYRAHVRWVRKFILGLNLERITLICQDWGGLIGLRILGQMPERFARAVAMNTGLPYGDTHTDAFLKWRRFSQTVGYLDVPKLIARSGSAQLTDGEAAAYSAPFPSIDYQTGAIAFPRLVPTHADDPGAYENRKAIEVLSGLDLPVLTVWSDADSITKPAEAMFRGIFKNAAPTIWIAGAGHFIQEEAGEEVSMKIRDWIRAGAVSTR